MAMRFTRFTSPPLIQHLTQRAKSAAFAQGGVLVVWGVRRATGTAATTALAVAWAPAVALSTGAKAQTALATPKHPSQAPQSTMLMGRAWALATPVGTAAVATAVATLDLEVAMAVAAPDLAVATLALAGTQVQAPAWQA